MKKCDVTINKGLTINAGNYESLRPEISITFKDMDVADMEDFYAKADEFANDLLAYSYLTLKGVKSVISSENPTKQRLEELQSNIESSVDVLNEFYTGE